MLETWICMIKIFFAQSNLRLESLKLNNSNPPFTKFAFILFEFLTLNTSLSSWWVEQIILRMSLYDFIVWLYSPNLFVCFSFLWGFLSLILRLDKPSCTLKWSHAVQFLLRSTWREVGPVADLGYLVRVYNDESIWSIYICSIKYRPCWIFFESFIWQIWWLTTVTSILTYPFNMRLLYKASTLFSSVLLLISNRRLSKLRQRC